MPKALAWILLGLVVAGFAASVWLVSFRVRASEAEVTRAVYAQVGRRGAPIHCVAQNSNHSYFHCLSARFGDDPLCKPVIVGVFGHIAVSNRIPDCE